MGFFSRRRQTLVRVKFRELASAVPDASPRGRYTYVWDISPAPQIGMRAFVDSGGELSPVVVVEYGQSEDLDGFSPDRIVRVATEQEIAGAHAAAQAAEGLWLDMMRVHAGLPTSGRPMPPSLPEGMDPIPPATGTARDAATADGFGRRWWRAHKRAENEAEAARFKDIANHWFAIRNTLQAEARSMQLRATDPDGLVRGRHYTEWAEIVPQLKREGKLEEALSILIDCMVVVRRAHPTDPPPWYFEHTAIILRKLKHGDEEVAVLRDYLRGNVKPSPKLVERYVKLTGNP